MVTNIGQVRQELACGQVFTIGSWQYPFGSAWVARERWCFAHAGRPLDRVYAAVFLFCAASPVGGRPVAHGKIS